MGYTCTFCGETFLTEAELNEHRAEEASVFNKVNAVLNSGEFGQVYMMSLLIFELKVLAVALIAIVEKLSMEEALDKYLQFIEYVKQRYKELGIIP